ncbi:MAG: chromate transporter [Clostridiales bacterium]|jgi:chromate transporter|nr:chromate transporter [Clostridiales bacterium]
MIYLVLFWEFFKIGLFSFGGGYAMIPIIKEVCINHNWISEDMLLNYIGISESTPGPIAINMATFVGSSQGGILGAIIATLGVVLPSFIIILIIAIALKNFIKNRYVQATLKGMRPVVVGLIIFTGLSLLLSVIKVYPVKEEISYLSIIIIAILFVLSFIYKKIRKKNIPTILIILLSGCLGLLFLI